MPPRPATSSLSSTPVAPKPPPGRGTGLNPPNRFERLHLEPDPEAPPEEQPHPRTQFFFDATESILTHNDSPDIPFATGLNPYRGCEHGCAYCYARPYHDYLGWSSGLEFETKILVKLRAPELLCRELASPKWTPQLVVSSGVTDCYQPAERHFRLTRQCLRCFWSSAIPSGLSPKISSSPATLISWPNWRAGRARPSR